MGAQDSNGRRMTRHPHPRVIRTSCMRWCQCPPPGARVQTSSVQGAELPRIRLLKVMHVLALEGAQSGASPPPSVS
eukprot:CAMPEP_0206544960 /NCGR_PEP_ID=MMETSP0325_2-20121206/11850_1 /ASSEMBLY_ACC=CAM_ASM_000347 /TAXON_ID=2866 /ORGANISM="Crypthecodinium cohnii, Strain Seligo" /LENGTH=75 /DNA_ID=CAMNT_0054043851 /DNA_START=46 /DNA_END=270 /DNA_ORIENTATION=-